jgi:hypothetical protein
MTKIFIGGSRKLSRLNDDIRGRIDSIMQNGYTVLIGDANGADKSVQKYLFDKNYRSVFVFCVGRFCRNNIGHWETMSVKEPSNVRDFHYYSIKDLEMVKEADYGFMIWDTKSKGTLNNMINLLKENKSVVVYLSGDKEFYTLRTFDDLEKLLSRFDKNHLETFEEKLKL